MDRRHARWTWIGLFLACGCGAAPVATDDAATSTAWTSYADPQGRFTIDLPAPPQTHGPNVLTVSVPQRFSIAVIAGSAADLAGAAPEEWSRFTLAPQDALWHVHWTPGIRAQSSWRWRWFHPGAAAVPW